MPAGRGAVQASSGYGVVGAIAAARRGGGRSIQAGRRPDPPGAPRRAGWDGRAGHAPPPNARGSASGGEYERTAEAVAPRCGAKSV